MEFHFSDGTIITDRASNCTPAGWKELWEGLRSLITP